MGQCCVAEMYGNPVAEAQSVVILKLSCSWILWLFWWTETVAVLVDCGLMREYYVFSCVFWIVA